MLRFFKDSWDYLDRYSCALYVSSILSNIFLLITLFLSFIVWDMNMIILRIFLFLSLISSIPYIVYYNYLKRKELK